MNPLFLQTRHCYPQPYGLHLLRRRGKRIADLACIGRKGLPCVGDGQRRGTAAGKGPALWAIRLSRWKQEG